VTLAQAQREAEMIAADLGRQYPETDAARSAGLVPLRTQFFGSVRESLFVLVGAVAFVLAIACANVASLLLGRATTRRKEIAVRLALGARRGRIVRQLLTESVMLAVAGACCGLILAWWGESALVRIAPAGVLHLTDEGTRLDGMVLAYTFALALLTGIVFGIVPALQASSSALRGDLNEGGTRTSASPRSARTREMLVAAQVAVALVLLIGAALLLRSFAALQRVDTGIDTHNLLTFDMFLSGARAEYQAQQVAFYDEALTRIARLPDVAAAGAAVTLPIGGDDFAAPFAVEGMPPPIPGQEPSAGFQVVTPGYFHAMGIPLLAGRDFRAGDTRAGVPVVLVNRTFARREWPGSDPIGRRIRVGRSDQWLTVIGVVGDIRHLGPATPPRAEFYQPHSQRSFPFMAFVVRTRIEPARVVHAIRAEVSRLDPAQPISGVATMEEHLARSLSRPRFMSTLVGAFGVLALVLSVVGIYGVMAYSVTARTREIAIRMALGARARSVMTMILSRTLALAAAGICAGLAGAAALTQVLSGLVFGVGVTDVFTFAAAAATLAAVALAAGLIPALRATKIEGAKVLRS
jgi:putative ABC transport system permease protein